MMDNPVKMRLKDAIKRSCNDNGYFQNTQGGWLGRPDKRVCPGCGMEKVISSFPASHDQTLCKKCIGQAR